MKSNILSKRCLRTVYSMYEYGLDEKQKENLKQIKDSDPYLNQIVEDVVHYVNYDLPLEPLIMERIKGELHVKC